MHQTMDKDPKLGPLGMCQANRDKPIMGLNCGMLWKLFKDFVYQSLQF